MGVQFGGFEIERRLGVGGMAETFVAVRRGAAQFEKRLVLKRVLPAFNSDPEFVRLFQNEARLAASLQHPNIAAVYDFGQTSGQWWMALELVEGCDLRAVLHALREHGQPMPLELVVLLGTELCRALAHAHERVVDGRKTLIVHRDLSPSNVLLSLEGAVKLADFGIAKAVTDSTHVTRSDAVKGKVPYMALEQALGEPLDARADLFALGVVLFECLAGVRPFDGPTELATLDNISKGRREHVLTLASHTPQPLADVVERLLSPRKEDRPASAHEVLDALASLRVSIRAERNLGELVRSVVEARARESDVQAHEFGGASAVTPEAAPLELRREKTAQRADEPATRTAVTPPPRRATWRVALAWSALGVFVFSGALGVTLAFARMRQPDPRATVLPEPAPLPTLPAPPPALPAAAIPPPAPAPEPQLVAAAPIEDRSKRARTRRETPDDSIHDDAPLASPPPSPAPAPQPAHSPAPAAPPAAAPAAEPPRAPSPPTRGTLRVTVVPIGDVFVDGARLGASPVVTELNTGPHRVDVESAGVRETRTVRVEEGQEAQVVIRIARNGP